MTGPAGGARGVFGIRAAVLLGPRRIALMILLALWLGVQPIVVGARPELGRPIDIGPDLSTYRAAGERVLEGHPIYALSSGDRPVPADNPPRWIVPFLSPPTVAVIWAGIVAAPPVVSAVVPWLAAIASMVSAVAFLIVRARAWMLPLIAVAIPGLAVAVWAGNVNAVVYPLLALAWLAVAREGNARLQAVLGIGIGVAVALKLGPAFIALWLAAQRRWVAAVTAATAVAIVLGLSVAVVGVAPFAEYLAVARQSSSAPEPLSIPGLLLRAGADPALASIGLAIFATLAGASIVLVRSRPRVGFAAAILASILATPVVRVETLSMAVFALVPWLMVADADGRSSWLRHSPLVLGPLVAAVALAVALVGAGLAPSTVAVANDRSDPIIVRFGTYPESSFGYRVAGGGLGLAWADEIGSAPRYAAVYTEDCVLVELLALGRPGGLIAVDDGGASLGSPTVAGALPFLAYDPTCAERWPPPGLR